MGEGVGIVEMEGVDHLFVVEHGQRLHAGQAVPVRAAHDHPALGVYGAHAIEDPLDYAVPHGDVYAVGLVHYFEYQLGEAALVAGGQLLPHGSEHLFHVRGGGGSGVSGVVEVEYQAHVQFVRPARHVVQYAPYRIGHPVTRFGRAELFEVDGQADDVRAQGAGVFKVRAGEPVPVYLFGSLELQPFGEIDAFGERRFVCDVCHGTLLKRISRPAGCR